MGGYLSSFPSKTENERILDEYSEMAYDKPDFPNVVDDRACGHMVYL